MDARPDRHMDIYLCCLMVNVIIIMTCLYEAVPPINTNYRPPLITGPNYLFIEIVGTGYWVWVPSSVPWPLSPSDRKVINTDEAIIRLVLGAGAGASQS